MFVDPWAGIFSDHLQEARMHLIGDEACAANEHIYSSGLFSADEMLCAGYDHGYVTVCNVS